MLATLMLVLVMLVEAETVKAPAVLPAVRSPMPPLLLFLVAACVTEEAKVLATPLTYAGYPYAGLGYAGAYGYAGYPYTIAAPARVEVETVEAPAVLPAVRRKMVHLESSRTRFYQTAAVPHRRRGLAAK